MRIHAKLGSLDLECNQLHGEIDTSEKFVCMYLRQSLTQLPFWLAFFECRKVGKIRLQNSVCGNIATVHQKGYVKRFQTKAKKEKANIKTQKKEKRKRKNKERIRVVFSF